MSDLKSRATFDFIRYSNCWEDADLLLTGLSITPESHLLSIASAGDNSLSMLSRHPERLVAIDLNPIQIALTELKALAFRELSYQEMFSFLGFERATDQERERTWNHLRTALTPDSRSLFDQNLEQIRRGLIHVGKFERYFALFRNRILPFVHNRKTVLSLLADRNLDERREFYRTTWDTRRWRWMFRLFFSRFVMGRLGRDPEFFRYVEGSVAERILERTRYALTEIPTQTNPYVHYILTGTFGETLPHYVRPENFNAIRESLPALQLRTASFEDILKERPQQFSGMNLSDIFEYMKPEETKALGEELLKLSHPGSRLVYWNMLAPRSLAKMLPDRIRRLERESEALFAEDRAFFYQQFHVDEVI
ncbi:MAG: DUF3419 family protein [Candidatus Kapaibacterium sp.]